MEHWFDELTRSLGQAPRTRRSMFGWAAKLGLVATGAALFGRPAQDAAAALLPIGSLAAVDSEVRSAADAPLAAACTVEDTYGVLTSLSVTSVQGQTPLTLTHQFASEVGSGATSSILTIVPGVIAGATPRVDPALRMSVATSESRAASSELMLGALYTGSTPRRSSFSSDGRTVQGVVDGRPTAPAPHGADARSIRFTNGQPVLDDPAPSPPQEPATPGERSVQDGGQRGVRPVQTTPQTGANEQRQRPTTGTPAASTALHEAITRLLQRSRREISTCAASPSAPRATVRCTECQLSCREAWVQCSLQAVQASLSSGVLAPSAYLSAASATCDNALQQCFSNCKSSGGCCPDYCRGDAACCQSSWGCCPPGTAPTSARWSKSWPTCPRCGPPPWTSASAAPPRTIQPAR